MESVPVKLGNGIVRRVVRRIESRLDALIHSTARRRAGQRVSSRRVPRRIVVVCYGNICRSPYAAEALRLKLADAALAWIEVDSVGFIGPGRAAHDQARAHALQRGADLSRHLSRQFSLTDARADLVLVMTREHLEALRRQFPLRDRLELLADFDVDDPPAREIADPYGADDAEFTRVFDQIDRSIDGLVRQLRIAASRGPTQGDARGEGW